ncbi:MAG: hypothetical protein GY809_14770, partial [Planctomycetes bacterium]|nr:hypothetical protein [Planctomycetota bacterium]
MKHSPLSTAMPPRPYAPPGDVRGPASPLSMIGTGGCSAAHGANLTSTVSLDGLRYPGLKQNTYELRKDALTHPPDQTMVRIDGLLNVNDYVTKEGHVRLSPIQQGNLLSTSPAMVTSSATLVGVQTGIN